MSLSKFSNLRSCDVATILRLHANAIVVDYYGDLFAERLKRELLSLADTFDDPGRYVEEEEEDEEDWYD